MLDVPIYVFVIGGILAFLIALYVLIPSRSRPQQLPRNISTPNPFHILLNNVWSFSPSDPEESEIPEHNTLEVSQNGDNKVHFFVNSESSKGEFDLSIRQPQPNVFEFINDRGELQFIIRNMLDDNERCIELSQYENLVCPLRREKSE